MSERFDDGATSPVPDAAEQTVHQVAGMRTNQIPPPAGPVAQWGRDVTVVLIHEKCGGSFAPVGQIGRAGPKMALWPTAYAFPMQCKRCSKLIGVVLCDPDHPEIELPKSSAFRVKGH